MELILITKKTRKDTKEIENEKNLQLFFEYVIGNNTQHWYVFVPTE